MEDIARYADRIVVMNKGAVMYLSLIHIWWSYRFSARKKNAGWRIEYFCVSESLQPRLKDAVIHTEIMGSDHCPVELDIE